MQQVLSPGLTIDSGRAPCCAELVLSWQEARPESGAEGNGMDSPVGKGIEL